MPRVLSSIDALNEANTRIQRVRATKAEYLDLSSQLRWLRRLPPIAEDVPSVETLNLSSTAITELEGLGRFPNLKELSLGWCSARDLRELRSLSKLEVFRGIGLPITTIEFHPSAPIAELALTNAKITSVPRLAKAAALRFLEIDGCPIESLEGIERYLNLEELEMDRTAIKSLDKLTALTKLRRLTASHTRVNSVEALRGLSTLEHLNINSTAVSDLSPLALLTQLRDGNGRDHANGWSIWRSGLEFKSTPLADRTLTMMADLTDPPRTKHVFDYLNNQITDAPPSDYEADKPPIEEENLPPQQPRGYSFRSAEDFPIQLEADEMASDNSGQRELHSELISLAAALKAVAARSNNTFPSLDDDVVAYESALGAAIEETSIRTLWSRGNKLRLWLRVDQSRRINAEATDPPLDDELSVKLNALVQTHNVFIVGDSVGRECDLNHLGPEGRLAAAQTIVAFRPVLSSLEGQTNVIDEAALDALQSTVEAADFNTSDQSIDAQQARAFAFVTLSNFCIELVRKSYIAVAKARRGSGPLTAIKDGALHRIGELPVDLAILGGLGVAGATVAFVAGSSPAIINVLVNVPSLEPLLQALRWLVRIVNGG